MSPNTQNCIQNNISGNDGESFSVGQDCHESSSSWPIASASRIKVRIQSDDGSDGITTSCGRRTSANQKQEQQQLHRLFYLPQNGEIVLVPCDDEDTSDRHLHSDENPNEEESPDFHSYLATLNRLNEYYHTASCNSNRKINDDPLSVSIKDSFHPQQNVIGARLSLQYNNNQNPNTFCGMTCYASATLVVYNYPNRGKGHGRCAQHKYYSLDPSSCFDLEDAKLIIRAIRQLARLHDNILVSDSDVVSQSTKLATKSKQLNWTLTQGQLQDPVKYLVILNPFAGGGGPTSPTGALCIYKKYMKPMLEQASIDHDVLVTNYAGHAKDRMMARKNVASDVVSDVRNRENDPGCDKVKKQNKLENSDDESKDISSYHAIIAMGGDGILYEIMQGIRSRPPHDQERLMSSIKFGIVGCGTSNGLAKSILHWSGEEYGALQSIFQICKGVVATLDIATYELLPKNDQKDVINDSYGDGSDTQSMEKLQQSKVKYITSFFSFSWGLIADCDLESECLRMLGTLRSDIWAVYRGVLFPRRYRARLSYLPAHVDCNNDDGVGEEDSSFNMPEFEEEVPEGWVSVEDDFTVFWACQTSHASYNMYNCPMSKMNDGLFHILVVR